MTPSLKPLSLLGIGSIPFEESVNSCEEIFGRCDLPFWPAYPARSLQENFVFQFLSSFPGLKVTRRTASFDEAKFARNLKEYRERLSQAFSKKSFLSFEPPSKWALGYSQMKVLLDGGNFSEKLIIKLQVTGPWTVWKSFFRDRIKTRPEKIQKELIRTLTAAGLAQIERIQLYGRTPLILIDEPIRAKDLSHLKEMVRAFRNRGALVGLHVCSSAAWEDFEALGIHLFHFDFTAHPRLALTNRIFLQNFLKQKKWVAWGIIPTARGSDFKTEDFSAPFLDRLREISDQELTLEEILKRSLIAPACGTGTLTPSQEGAVQQSLRLTSESLEGKNTAPHVKYLFLKHFRLKYHSL